MVFHYYYSFCTQSFTQMLYHTAGWLCCAQIFIVVWHEREGGGKYILEWFGGQVSYGKINSLHLEIIVVICLQHIAVIWQCSRDAEDNKYLHFGTNFIHLDTWLVNDLLIIRSQFIINFVHWIKLTFCVSVVANMNGIIIDESGLSSFKSFSMLHGECFSSEYHSALIIITNFLLLVVIMIAYSSEMMGFK